MHEPPFFPIEGDEPAPAGGSRILLCIALAATFLAVMIAGETLAVRTIQSQIERSAVAGTMPFPGDPGTRART